VIPATVGGSGKMSCKATFKSNGHSTTYGHGKVKVRHAGKAQCLITPSSVGLALFVGTQKKIKFKITISFNGTTIRTTVKLHL
jgi:hypothetical protein